LIERLYIKNGIGFDEVELFFKKGLIVFTGPSGAGKTVLLNGLLSLFAFKSVESSLQEVIINMDIQWENYGIDVVKEAVLRSIKKEKVRYFINSQAVPKKVLIEVFKEKISYLSQKDTDIFKSENLLNIIDTIAKKIFPEFAELKKSYIKLFEEYSDLLKGFKVQATSG